MNEEYKPSPKFKGYMPLRKRDTIDTISLKENEPVDGLGAPLPLLRNIDSKNPCLSSDVR